MSDWEEIQRLAYIRRKCYGWKSRLTLSEHWILDASGLVPLTREINRKYSELQRAEEELIYK